MSLKLLAKTLRITQTNHKHVTKQIGWGANPSGE